MNSNIIQTYAYITFHKQLLAELCRLVIASSESPSDALNLLRHPDMSVFPIEDEYRDDIFSAAEKLRDDFFQDVESDLRHMGVLKNEPTSGSILPAKP
jgi:hypothetical protein